MREQSILLEIVEENALELHNLVNYLGNRNNETREVKVRYDLPKNIMDMVIAHASHHVEHDWANPHDNKFIHRINEGKTLFWGGIHYPIASAQAVIFRRNLIKSNRNKKIT